VLLDRRPRQTIGQQLLDIAGDGDRADAQEVIAALVAPRAKGGDGARVGGARVRVADIGGEELDEAPGGFAAWPRRSPPAR
jgi:hypothetical protein